MLARDVPYLGLKAGAAVTAASLSGRADTEASRSTRRLPAAAHAELGEDGADMVVDRLLGDVKTLGDLSVTHVLADESQDLKLAVRQPGRVALGRWPWPPRNPSGAALAKQARCDRGRGTRLEALEDRECLPMLLRIACTECDSLPRTRSSDRAMLPPRQPDPRLAQGRTVRRRPQSPASEARSVCARRLPR